jgi:vitamin B12 transporter
VLPFQPRLVFSPGIAYASSLDFESVDRVALYARYVHQASRYADRAGLAVIPAQGNLELGGEAELFHALVARVRVNNALDQNRFDVVGFPLPGTSLFASLEARL